LHQPPKRVSRPDPQHTGGWEFFHVRTEGCV